MRWTEAPRGAFTNGNHIGGARSTPLLPDSSQLRQPADDHPLPLNEYVMATASPSESMKSNFKSCLFANMVSILLMFGSALLIGVISRRYLTGLAVSNPEPSLLFSSHFVATRLALFVGLPAFVIAFVGMLRFQPWARKLFAFLVLAWGLQILVFGIFNVHLWLVESILRPCTTDGRSSAGNVVHDTD